jgi:1-deoxy-D-xylulose-5-phosphate synthase
VITYSQAFSRTLLQLAKEDPRILVITAAMTDGNCLQPIAEAFPERFYDVGICEQHAVTLAAGLAAQGFIPVVAIYSTFLQRSFDQILNDVCVQDLPVVFAIDRSGIVGEDGKTHQGIFDLSYLTLMPNMIVAAPKDEDELQHLLYTATRINHPVAIRYPRGAGTGVPLSKEYQLIPAGKGEMVRTGSDIAIVAIGASVQPALEAAWELAKVNIDAAVANARFAKPIDSDLILTLAAQFGKVVTVEENTLNGGFGSSVMELFEKSGLHNVKLRRIGIPDEFVEHGSPSQLKAKYNLDAKGISRQVHALFPELKSVEAQPELR